MILTDSSAHKVFIPSKQLMNDSVGSSQLAVTPGDEVPCIWCTAPTSAVSFCLFLSNWEESRFSKSTRVCKKESAIHGYSGCLLNIGIPSGGVFPNVSCNLRSVEQESQTCMEIHHDWGGNKDWKNHSFSVVRPRELLKWRGPNGWCWVE